MDSIDLSEVPLARWLAPRESWGRLEIVSVKNVAADKRKLDLELTVEDEKASQFRFSLWGKNLVYMINTFGPITANWKGKHIYVHFEDVEGKTHRRIEKA